MQLEAASVSSATLQRKWSQRWGMDLVLMGGVTQLQGQHTAYSCKLLCTMVCIKGLLLLLKPKPTQPGKRMKVLES